MTDKKQEVTFEPTIEPSESATQAAQDVRLAVSVENGKLRVKSGVRSGLAVASLASASALTTAASLRQLDVTRFIAVNAPFKLAAQA